MYASLSIIISLMPQFLPFGYVLWYSYAVDTPSPIGCMPNMW